MSGSWRAELHLTYRREGARTVVHDRHSGPLRILRSLYPEGDGICHNVVVHPPAGIAGGDRLSLHAELGEGAHALVTTPGATRFYRSLGDDAVQDTRVVARAGSRLEWLPQETICYRQALAETRLRFTLAVGAEMIGWDVLALGRPAGGEAFDAGRCTQQIEVPGIWLERGTVEGEDSRLQRSPLGWAGHTVLGTMWFAAGGPLTAPRREALLDTARAALRADAKLGASAGATSPHEPVVVLRVLGPRVEPVMALLRAVWAGWRREAWALEPVLPRVWGT